MALRNLSAMSLVKCSILLMTIAYFGQTTAVPNHYPANISIPGKLLLISVLQTKNYLLSVNTSYSNSLCIYFLPIKCTILVFAITVYIAYFLFQFGAIVTFNSTAGKPTNVD